MKGCRAPRVINPPSVVESHGQEELHRGDKKNDMVLEDKRFIWAEKEKRIFPAERQLGQREAFGTCILGCWYESRNVVKIGFGM